MDDHARRQPTEQLEDAGARVDGEAPHPTDEMMGECFLATRREVDARAASVAKPAPEDAPQARTSREIEEDDRVGTLEAAGRFRAQEVAFDDPRVAARSCAD